MRQSACLDLNQIIVYKYAAGGLGVRLNDGPDLKSYSF